MGFKNNYENASNDSFEAKPDGTYEVIIKSIKEKEYQKDGQTKKSLSLMLLIRNDVDQPSQNGYLFHTYWKRKSPNEMDAQVRGYSFNQIMWLAKMAKLPEDKEYETLADLCNDLIGKCISVVLKHNGKYENIVEIGETQYPECKHRYKPSSDISADDDFALNSRGNSFKGQQSAADFAAAPLDDDLPF